MGEEGVQGVKDAFVAIICFTLPVASPYRLRDLSFVSSLLLDYNSSRVRKDLIEICFL